MATDKFIIKMIEEIQLPTEENMNQNITKSLQLNPDRPKTAKVKDAAKSCQNMQQVPNLEELQAKSEDLNKEVPLTSNKNNSENIDLSATQKPLCKTDYSAMNTPNVTHKPRTPTPYPKTITQQKLAYGSGLSRLVPVRYVNTNEPIERTSTVPIPLRSQSKSPTAQFQASSHAQVADNKKLTADRCTSSKEPKDNILCGNVLQGIESSYTLDNSCSVAKVHTQILPTPRISRREQFVYEKRLELMLAKNETELSEQDEQKIARKYPIYVKAEYSLARTQLESGVGKKILSTDVADKQDGVTNANNVTAATEKQPTKKECAEETQKRRPVSGADEVRSGLILAGTKECAEGTPLKPAEIGADVVTSGLLLAAAKECAEQTAIKAEPISIGPVEVSRSLILNAKDTRIKAKTVAIGVDKLGSDLLLAATKECAQGIPLIPAAIGADAVNCGVLLATTKECAQGKPLMPAAIDAVEVNCGLFSAATKECAQETPLIPAAIGADAVNCGLFSAATKECTQGKPLKPVATKEYAEQTAIKAHPIAIGADAVNCGLFPAATKVCAQGKPLKPAKIGASEVTNGLLLAEQTAMKAQPIAISADAVNCGVLLATTKECAQGKPLMPAAIDAVEVNCGLFSAATKECAQGKPLKPVAMGPAEVTSGLLLATTKGCAQGPPLKPTKIGAVEVNCGLLIATTKECAQKTPVKAEIAAIGADDVNCEIDVAAQQPAMH